MAAMDRDALKNWAVREFESWSGARPTHVATAPGRVELLGNHTDYNEGWVLTAAVGVATAVAVRLRNDDVFRLRSHHPDYPDVEFRGTSMARVGGGQRWSNYVRGVIAEFAREGTVVPGADFAIVSTVPDGSGVSSSAALLVSVARAIEAIAGRAPRTGMEIAKLCRRAENGAFVGAPVGILDQFSSACGQAGHALMLDCRTLDWKPVPLPPDECGLLLANSGVRHELAAGGGYADRRAACFRVAKEVAGRSDASLRDVEVAVLESRRHAIDPTDWRRAKHVLDENARVHDGARALSHRDYAAFGDIMTQSHHSCRDLFENSCPEVDLLVETALAAGAYGAKLTGGGWGGAAVIAHPPAARPAIEAALRAAWSARTNQPLQILATAASEGALAEGIDS